MSRSTSAGTWLECAAADAPAKSHALPGDRPQWPRDRVVDVRHILFDLRLDVPAKSVEGTVTHTVTVINDGLRSIAFDAVEMQVASVTVNSVPVPFSYDGRQLILAFSEGRKRGDRLNIAIAYRATPRIGLYFIGPDDPSPNKPAKVWSQSQDEAARYWFPCYDYQNEKQTPEMIVRVPADWTALSNGRLIKEKVNRDGT